jgi:hypothetical protein
VDHQVFLILECSRSQDNQKAELLYPMVLPFLIPKDLNKEKEMGQPVKI